MLQINVLIDETLSLEVLDLDGLDEDAIIAHLTKRVADAVTAAARYGDCTEGEINVRITDDSTIHQINRDHLQHDYPTDVISFSYELEPPALSGELVVSLDTAASVAKELKETGHDETGHGETGHDGTVLGELLLYVVHGTLHLVGWDDTDDECRTEMRAAESDVMAAFR